MPWCSFASRFQDPSLDLLTYAVPAGEPTPSLGARAVVPLGSRSVTGIIVDVSPGHSAPDGTTIRPLLKVLDTAPFIPEEVIELARWTADYYAAGRSETIAAVLPPKTRGEEQTPTRCGESSLSPRLATIRR